jgi:glycosyltransferase involved in cell wall biosynthesis
MNLKVLITGSNFKDFTGSELYMFDLAVGLKNNGCDVTISSKIGSPLKSLSESEGIKLIPSNRLSGTERFDIIHTQHTNITRNLIHLYPKTPKVMTIHSEIIPLENPIIHHSIVKYIAVREGIKNKLINQHKINLSNIELIHNPIDTNKFNSESITDGNYVLFVGTIDYLRKNTIFDLVEYSKNKNKDFYIVGKNKSIYLNQVLKNKHVKHFSETADVEKFVKGCSETGSIMLGRTLIEGWLCNKPGLQYIVDKKGNIQSIEKSLPPDNLYTYSRDYVSRKIKELYLDILK